MTDVTPEPIVRIAQGFMAAKFMFAANELGLFEALSDSPADLDALASRTGLTRRSIRITADAMVALELLERDGDVYRNAPVADRFLTGGQGLQPLLRHWDQISYPTWESLASALATGPVQEATALPPEKQQIMCAGIEAILAGPADALAQTVDFGAHRRLMDVGCGTGSWTITALRHHPQLTATLVDLPVVADIANKRVAAEGLADRADVVAADALADPLPDGHDVVLVANLVHYFSPETNHQLLRSIRGASETGTRLLLADFWTDPTHTQPLPAALMAGEFAVHVPEGDVYSVEEVRSWLPETGWRFDTHQPLAGPQSLITAVAV
jgi:SAM-dependent methyltransferase